MAVVQTTCKICTGLPSFLVIVSLEMYLVINEYIKIATIDPEQYTKTYICEMGLFLFNTMWKKLLHLCYIRLVLIKSAAR